MGVVKQEHANQSELHLPETLMQAFLYNNSLKSSNDVRVEICG